jgi:hypothetical protein
MPTINRKREAGSGNRNARYESVTVDLAKRVQY